MIWHHISTWVCGLARGHMERRRGLAVVFRLRIQLDCKHSWYCWHDIQSWWIVNQEFEARKETKQSQVLTRSWMWSGSELVVVVVWIGSGSVWIRVWIGPEVDSHVCVYMLQLGCSMTRKGRQGVQAASVQLGCLAGWPYNLQQCQLGSLTAWMCNSCSFAAGLLDCLAA